MLTVKHALLLLRKTLQKHDHPSDQEPWWLLEKIMDMPQAKLISQSSLALTTDQQKKLHGILSDIDIHKPIAYILGTVPFLDLELSIKPPILIPRPETEYWCFELIQMLKKIPEQKFKILDLCTGSGCIGLALAHALPQAQVIAIDINPDACTLAQENAQRNKIYNIKIIQSDLFEALPNEMFDIIVSNPPYIATQEFTSLDQSVKLWEDYRALVALDEGFALIKKIIIGAKERLSLSEVFSQNNIPQLWIEIGYLQGEKTKFLMQETGFCKVTIMKDMYHKDRVVLG